LSTTMISYLYFEADFLIASMHSAIVSSSSLQGITKERVFLAGITKKRGSIIIKSYPKADVSGRIKWHEGKILK
jgi:hypothetical protein